MDIALAFADKYVFTPYVYPSSWPESDTLRQFISLNIITDIGGALLYLITATISYFLVFDKRLLKHPQILENQVYKEITYTLKSVPFMGLPTALVFLFEVKGYSKLFDSVADSYYGWFGIAFSAVTFLLFTDCLIYWIHRGLHHRLVYANIHKPHHAWKVPTPYASHAFHPIDGFLQSVPYHIYAFLFPMHKLLYLALYVMVNIWTVSIHDGDFRVPSSLKPILNGAAHHTDHHLYYTCNYGQYLTLWDRIGGSFKNPGAFQGSGPLDQILMGKSCCRQGDEDVKGK
jgi:lathosterol oxidase